jgi:hypothetical protein
MANCNIVRVGGEFLKTPNDLTDWDALIKEASTNGSEVEVLLTEITSGDITKSIGAPINVYGYGALITISFCDNSWMSMQFYIPDSDQGSQSSQRVYKRTLNRDWSVYNQDSIVAKVTA